jgi:UDP-2,3-diacylglucosamine pyrophosphatase LpxH
MVRLLCPLFAIGLLAAALSGTESNVQPAKSRAIVVLSDIHMGVGRDRAGQWHPYEDFRWGTELAAFLDAINAAGGGATDLILNGDTFELQQSIERECEYADAELGCTEAEARRRLERVIAGHDAEIKALGRFARSGSNRVVLVPGDHDAALLFSSVGRRVVNALDAPRDRVEVASAGYWLSSDRQVLAEHGHQIGFSPERFERWPSPFVRRSGVEHLVRTWGEQVIGSFNNRYEPVFPLVDNVVQGGAGMKYAVAAIEATDIGADPAGLLRYSLLVTPWLQFRLDYDGGDMQAPAWDLQKIRAEGPAFLIGALPDDDHLRPIALKALQSGRLNGELEQFSDDQLEAICDYRAAVRRARRRMERGLTQLSWQGPAVAECPRTPDTRGSAFEYFWRSRDRVFMRRLEELGRTAPDAKVSVLVYGHTHLADRSQAGFNAINGGAMVLPPEGFSPVRNAFAPIAINGGAWQRTITPVQLERIKVARGLPDRDLLRAVTLEELPSCYSFVQIEPYVGTPVPVVRYWRASENGSWSLAGGCGR